MAKFNILRLEGESKADFRRRYRREWERLTREALGLPTRRPKAPCSVDGCEDIATSKGMCAKHYHAQWAKARSERSDLVPGKRDHPLYSLWWERKNWGSLCDAWANDFWAFAGIVGERPSPTHLLRRPNGNEPYGPDNWEWLAALKRQPGESKKDFYARKWQNQMERFPSRESQRSLIRKYNVTPEQYDTVLRAQGGLCAICREAETRIHPKTAAPQALSLDHCHDTGEPRGLLCWRCNTTLGKVNHSIEPLQAMIEFLQAPPWKELLSSQTEEDT